MCKLANTLNRKETDLFYMYVYPLSNLAWSDIIKSSLTIKNIT